MMAPRCCYASVSCPPTGTCQAGISRFSDDAIKPTLHYIDTMLYSTRTVKETGWLSGRRPCGCDSLQMWAQKGANPVGGPRPGAGNIHFE